jgi:hypothetical protein
MAAVPRRTSTEGFTVRSELQSISAIAYVTACDFRYYARRTLLHRLKPCAGRRDHQPKLCHDTGVTIFMIAGIDLGSTNSFIAVRRGGKATRIAGENGRPHASQEFGS